MSDYILLILGIILMIIGIIGCLVPVLPGPPLSFLGLILLHLSRFGHFATPTLITLGCHYSCCNCNGLYRTGMGHKKIRWFKVRNQRRHNRFDNRIFSRSPGYNIRTINWSICRRNDIQR